MTEVEKEVCKVLLKGNNINNGVGDGKSDDNMNGAADNDPMEHIKRAPERSTSTVTL